MKDTQSTSQKKPTSSSAQGPQSKGWKDADYNEGGGIKDVGGRSSPAASKQKKGRANGAS